MAALNEAQKEFYRENGYLLIENAIGRDALETVRGQIATFLDQSRGVSQDNDLFELAVGHSPQTPRLNRLKDPAENHPVFWDLMCSDAIVGPVSDLLGGSVRFDHSKLNFKPAGGKTEIHWHQDWAFYPHTNDDLLAVGVMIEDCTDDNGPLMVVPGSHRGPVYDHHQEGCFVGGIRMDDVAAQLKHAVALTAPAGSISIHHVRTLHGSQSNRTDRARPLLLFSYAAVDAFPVFAETDLSDYDQRIIRGEPTLVPRSEAVPMRLPFPRAGGTSSIFVNQSKMHAAAT